MRHRKLAVHLDYQNVYKYYEDKKQFKIVLDYIESFIHSITTKTSKISKKVYIRNTNTQIDVFRSWFRKHGWKILHGPDRKDIDTRMTADIVFDCSKSKFTAFLIISGDADFEPAITCIRKTRKTSYVLACKHTYRKTNGIMNLPKYAYLLPFKCNKCGGTGWYDKDENKVCWDCNGIGIRT